MRDLIDVRGASGAVYRFNLVGESRPLSPMGGNYLYVREDGDGYEIVHVGETENLMAAARTDWAEAVQMRGAGHLFTRLNISERVRQQEHEDIVQAAGAPPSQSASEIED
jgi:hypothetical protein